MIDAASCRHCEVGYHPPFERFEHLAALADGPVMLWRCKVCGTLWEEALHDARRVTEIEAAGKFPGLKI